MLKNKTFFWAFAIAALLLCACGNNAKKELNRLLVELADSDQTIDADDWAKLSDFLDKNKVHFKEFYDNGQLDEDDVEEYISDFFAKRRPPKKISFIGIGAKPLSFHIYLERSGSMAAYDSPDGDGSFRAAVMAMENSLPGKTKVDSIGEQGYTDFRQIFTDLLSRTKDGEVGILFTDLIYSTRDMKGVNPERVFNELREMVNAVFKDNVKKKSLLVVRMMGSYNGPYYSYDNSVSQYNGRRPYFIIIVGDNANILRLTKDPALRSFAEMEKTRGYDNMCLFTDDDIYHPYYSFLLEGDGVRGRFRPEKGQGSQITSLEDIKADRDAGDVQLALAVDLSGMLIDSRYLTDKRNYEVESPEVTIKEIRPITKKDRTPNEEKYIGSATHIFILSLPAHITKRDFEIRLLNHLPAWVDAASTDNDLHPDGRTTFALSHLLRGISESYERNADKTPAYFELDINIKN